MTHGHIEETLFERRWVVARYGVQRPQFLSASGAWDSIGNAAWFAAQATSYAAVCRSGTTGIVVRMDALRIASQTPETPQSR